MTKVLHPEKFKLLLQDYETLFEGWDFSHIESTGRIRESPLRWSYGSILMNYLIHADYVLDMGTGGGEFLSSLLFLPTHTFATESYIPNVPVAKKKLSILNIPIFTVNHAENLPFESNFFEIVMNRHDYFQSEEVYRILRPKRFFITQQVGDKNANEINLWFNAKTNENSWNAEIASSDLIKCHFTILEVKEMITKTRFFDIGAVLFFLKVISWQIPSFTIQRYYSRIIELHNKIETDGFFDCSCHRFLIIAQKN